MSKIGSGLRIGGPVELCGLYLPANYRRAEILVEKAKSFLPGLDTTGGVPWMGFRPSLPGSLSVIRRATSCPNVIYALDHEHLGLTQSAGTAELVSALVNARVPEIDLTAFNVARFGGVGRRHRVAGAA